MTNRYSCHVISNTHWDREWRYPFQAYRTDLVEMMDGLLDLLERRPDYRSFLLDSQTVILEDYLEVRPENADRIRAQVAADRLQIGPWYTLPDEWGCPGEALVRNLLVGHRVGKPFGPITKVGYTPFSNGQISQLPQLYAGFGIDSCFFYRGVGKHVAKQEFLWEGADGSTIFGFKFGDYARYNYYYLAYRPGLLGKFRTDREFPWEPQELPWRVCVDQSQDRQYGWLAQERRVRPENLAKALEETRHYSIEDATTSQILYMMGHDHSFAAEEELDLIEALQREAGPDGDRIFHSALNDYMTAFRAEAKDLQTLRGEMRHTNKQGLWTTLMANILSCRLYLKQRNARVNVLLTNVTEPLCTMAWTTAGAEYPARLLEIAWKKNLVNHAHDAIGGCSVDRVHEEMLVRWNDVEILCEETGRRAIRAMLPRIDGSAIDPKHHQITLFNTLPFARTGQVEIVADLPHAAPDAPFAIESLDGRPVPAQEVARESYVPTIEGPYELTMPFPATRVRTRVQVSDLPAGGHDVLVLKPGVKGPAASRDLVANDREIENEFLHVRVEDDGTLTLTDKRTGVVREGLGVLEDTAEFGDPWSRVVPDGAQPLYSRNGMKEVVVERRGALEGRLRVRLGFRVPEGRGADGQRSATLVELPVDLVVSLEAGRNALLLDVELDNRASDHRLRVLFPTNIAGATHSVADGQFDVLARPIALPDPTGWKEPPYATNPMWSWVDVSDGREGMAVLNDGLIEQEVTDTPDRTIAITLLRGFGKFVYGRPVPGAQCHGRHAYRFAIIPHTGTWSDANLFREALHHTTPVLAVQSAPMRGSDAPRRSLFAIAPERLVFSALKQGEDPSCVVVRVWNPGDADEEMVLAWGQPVASAEELTLEEIPVRQLPVTSSGDHAEIRLTVASKKIATIGLRLTPA